MPYQAAGIHSNKQSRDLDTNRDVRLLDTIAVALTTGNPGDVFAASFDKRQHMQLVLAKNGLPTPEDVSAANELISLIGCPSIADAMDLFPFLLRRCSVNIDKRIYNLHTCIQDGELLNDFMLGLQAYAPEADIKAEFRGADKVIGDCYGDAVPAFALVWGDLVKTLTDRTAQGLNAEDVPSSRQKYAKLFLLANALWRSRFLKALTDGHILLNNDRKERAEKLKRRLGKVCQHFSGVSDLIRRAKRLFPFPHRWVMDTFTGTGEGVLNLCDSAYDAVSGINRSPLSPDIVDKVDRHFPSIHRNWEKRKTVHACIHAEIRIILHLGPPSLHDRHVHPIGVSKQSCFCCAVWLESHNCIFGTQWMTSGSHGKPYANWALPGAACSYAIGADGRSSVDEAVLKAVSTRLTGALDWLLPGQKSISDELVSSGDDGEQERSGYEGCSHHRTVKNNWRKKLEMTRDGQNIRA